MPWKSRRKHKPEWILQLAHEQSPANGSMKKTAPGVKLLGKILFPSQPAWQRHANASFVLWGLALGLLTGGIIAVIMYTHNKPL